MTSKAGFTELHEAAPALDAEAAALLHRLARSPEEWALFLDIDGTLLDIADAPEAVRVPPRLCDTLQRLALRLGGALALVTGRNCDWAARLFAPASLAIAGLHGVQRLRADGSRADAVHPAGADDARRELEAISWPGVHLEDKGHAVALHYRNAPERGEDVSAVMRRVRALLGEDWALQHGKMVVELRPAGADKGQAVAAFLDEPPFLGRRPLTVGDDLTDESMFRVAHDRDGASIRIGPPPHPSIAMSRLETPGELRRLLEEIAG